MTENDETGGLAPVIPLFGGGEARTAVTHDAGAEPPRDGGRRYPVRRLPASGESDDEGDAHAEPEAPAAHDASDGPAVRGETDSTAGSAEEWHTTWRGLDPGGQGLRPAPVIETVERGGVHFLELPQPGGAAVGASVDAPTLDDAAEKAERKLLRSLGSRGLSVAEARSKLRAQGLQPDAIDDVIARLERTGALDDTALAEQVVFQATTHRNEGRKAIAQSLAKRGISRDIVDSVVAELPDDDYERALEFARGKARQLARLDDEVALRRLVGQLSRRGYGGLAMSVARRALDEQARPARGTVRFE